MSEAHFDRSGRWAVKWNSEVGQRVEAPRRRPAERTRQATRSVARLGQILQDRSAYRRVEGLGARDASRRFPETHVGKSGLGDPGSRHGDLSLGLARPHHRAGWADKLRSEHRDVANAGADVEHPLPRAYSRVAEEALGERIPDHRWRINLACSALAAPRG